MVTCRAHERVREANGVVDGLLSNHAEVEHAREEYTKLREQGGPNSTQGIREQEEQGEEWYSPGRDLVSLRPEQQEENLEGGGQATKNQEDKQQRVISSSPSAPRFTPRGMGLERMKTVWERKENGDGDDIKPFKPVISSIEQPKKLKPSICLSRRSAPAATASAGAEAGTVAADKSNELSSGAVEVNQLSVLSMFTSSPNNPARVPGGTMIELKSEIARVQELLAVETRRADVLEARASRREQNLAGLVNPQPKDPNSV